MKTIAIKDQCEECAGRGYFIYDSCTHQGEHQQHEEDCDTCQSTGVKNK